MMGVWAGGTMRFQQRVCNPVKVPEKDSWDDSHLKAVVTWYCLLLMRYKV